MPVVIKNGRRLSLQAWLKAVSKKRGIIAADEYYAAKVWPAMTAEEVDRLTKLKDADAVLLNARELYARKHGCSEREAADALDREYNNRCLVEMAGKPTFQNMKPLEA